MNDVARAYDGVERLHVAARLRLCPFTRLARLLPRVGDLVDLGGGHGHFALLMALDGPERQIRALDVDERKLASGRLAADRLGLGDRVTMASVASSWPPEDPVAGVSIVDVLYLLERDAQEALVRSAARSLSPGGTLLVKEMDLEHHRVKAGVLRVEELLMTRILRRTQASATALRFTAPAVVRGWMHAEGLDVVELDLGRGYTAPHHALVGTR